MAGLLRFFQNATLQPHTRFSLTNLSQENRYWDDYRWSRRDWSMSLMIDFDTGLWLILLMAGWQSTCCPIPGVVIWHTKGQGAEQEFFPLRRRAVCLGPAGSVHAFLAKFFTWEVLLLQQGHPIFISLWVLSLLFHLLSSHLRDHNYTKLGGVSHTVVTIELSSVPLLSVRSCF